MSEQIAPKVMTLAETQQVLGSAPKQPKGSAALKEVAGQRATEVGDTRFPPYGGRTPDGQVPKPVIKPVGSDANSIVNKTKAPDVVVNAQPTPQMVPQQPALQPQPVAQPQMMPQPVVVQPAAAPVQQPVQPAAAPEQFDVFSPQPLPVQEAPAPQPIPQVSVPFVQQVPAQPQPASVMTTTPPPAQPVYMPMPQTAQQQVAVQPMPAPIPVPQQPVAQPIPKPPQIKQPNMVEVLVEQVKSLSEQLLEAKSAGALQINPNAGQLKSIDEHIEPTKPQILHDDPLLVAANLNKLSANPEFLDNHPFDTFHEQRKRATLELADGTFTIPIIAAQPTSYSVCLFIPLSDSSVSFVPKPGTELTVTVDSLCEKVYFPGTYTEVNDLGMGIMHLIKAKE
jgi:hypothetical protein